MITEMDLRQAIAECQGERNPNAQTCIKLAAYYTILNQMAPTQTDYPIIGYSADSAPEGIAIDSDTEFASRVNGRNPSEVWAIIDELVETIRIVNPRLYQSVMRKLE